MIKINNYGIELKQFNHELNAHERSELHGTHLEDEIAAEQDFIDTL